MGLKNSIRVLSLLSKKPYIDTASGSFFAEFKDYRPGGRG